jgi:hypothetical protein
MRLFSSLFVMAESSKISSHHALLYYCDALAILLLFSDYTLNKKMQQTRECWINVRRIQNGRLKCYADGKITLVFLFFFVMIQDYYTNAYLASPVPK